MFSFSCSFFPFLKSLVASYPFILSFLVHFYFQSSIHFYGRSRWPRYPSEVFVRSFRQTGWKRLSSHTRSWTDRVEHQCRLCRRPAPAHWHWASLGRSRAYSWPRPRTGPCRRASLRPFLANGGAETPSRSWPARCGGSRPRTAGKIKENEFSKLFGSILI